MTAEPVAVVFWSIQTPGGPILLAECRHPESNGERPDVPLSDMCQLHTRSISYCADEGILWCDGGPPSYRWHAFDFVPLDHEPDDLDE
jgi:hypothetical protein